MPHRVARTLRAGCNSNNIASDPLFDNPANNNFRLIANSPCKDTGLDSALSADTYDLDQDGCPNEKTPDLDCKDRIYGEHIDMGAYEWRPAYSCPWDINGNGCVNIDDLFAVILNWGQCSTNCVECIGDITGGVGPNGFVNVDDLFAVIMHWNLGCTCNGYPAPCPCCPNPHCGSQLPQSVQDCFDLADELAEAYTPKWFEILNGCKDDLCKREPQLCDE
jgi:hypothetical protein